SLTFMQPFLTYTTKTFTTFGFNTETTYDWERHQGRCRSTGPCSVAENREATHCLSTRCTLLRRETHWRSRLGTALHDHFAVSEMSRRLYVSQPSLPRRWWRVKYAR